MDRRTFLKVLGVAGAAATVPVVALAKPAAPVPAGQAQLGRIKETIIHRIDLPGSPWLVHYYGAFDGREFDFSILFLDKPTERLLATRVRPMAVQAINRARMKHG